MNRKSSERHPFLRTRFVACAIALIVVVSSCGNEDSQDSIGADTDASSDPDKVQTTGAGAKSASGTGDSDEENDSANGSTDTNDDEQTSASGTGDSDEEDDSANGDTNDAGETSEPGDAGDPGSGAEDAPPDSTQDTEKSPESTQDLPFVFFLKEVGMAISARVVGGKSGTSIVVSRFPTQFDYKIAHGPLPLGYPDALSPEFCEDIEESVATVEEGGALAELQRQRLREFPGVMLQVPYGSYLVADLEEAAIQAAQRAGATASSLFVSNGATLENVELQVEFESDALTRRMGDHETAAADFAADFESFGQGGTGLGFFVTGTSWPDLLCDLYTSRARIEAEIQEESWVSRAKSNGLVAR